jgi:hypothetical protein
LDRRPGSKYIATARRPVVFAIGGITVIEVRRFTEVAGGGHALRHRRQKLVDSVLVLDQHHGRKRPAATGLTEI